MSLVYGFVFIVFAVAFTRFVLLRRILPDSSRGRCLVSDGFAIDMYSLVRVSFGRPAGLAANG